MANNADTSRESSVEHFLDMIRKLRQGKLKVYLGLAAGVGKTYRMLDEAHALRKLGIEILVGFIDTHGRTDTARRLEGLPVLSRKKIYYRGKELEEFDVDAALSRHPEVILVDEFAHSNAPGSRNEKRYQDIEELLNAGVNVITTLNIQHLESLNNIVEKITGIEVLERIPDGVLQSADEVVNVDLTADELIERLKEGKIYSLEKVEIALRNFFQRDNLLKLRELALREAADQAERKIDSEVQTPEKKQLGKIAVCISTNKDSSETLIRKTARLSDRLGVHWYALFVETPDVAPDKIDLATQRHLINNFKLATELGGHVEKVVGSDVVEEIRKYAKEKQIQLLVVGKPERSGFMNMLKKSVPARLITAIEDDKIDIQIVST